jgi:hypothetical protein
VVWPTGDSAFDVQAALWGSAAGCLSPNRPVAAKSPPRVRWIGRFRLARGNIVLGTVSCPLRCTVVARVFEERRAHRVQIAGRRLRLPAGAHRKLTAALSRRGKSLLSGSGRLSVTADVIISSGGTVRVRQSRTSRLPRG